MMMKLFVISYYKIIDCTFTSFVIKSQIVFKNRKASTAILLRFNFQTDNRFNLVTKPKIKLLKKARIKYITELRGLLF